MQHLVYRFYVAKCQLQYYIDTFIYVPVLIFISDSLSRNRLGLTFCKFLEVGYCQARVVRGDKSWREANSEVEEEMLEVKTNSKTPFVVVVTLRNTHNTA